MAHLDIFDELNARLRSRLADQGGDVRAFVERLIQDQLDYEDDPLLRSQLLEKTRQEMAEIDAGLGVDARESMREIAEEFGINLKR